jgi:hypothetical protein
MVDYPHGSVCRCACFRFFKLGHYHRARSHDAVIRVYDETGNVIESHEHTGEFREF